MRKLFSVAAICLVLSACGDAFTPDGTSGTYDLTLVNGIAMPASISIVEDGITVQFSFDTGTLTLRAAGTYTFASTLTITSGSTTVSETETESGTFALQEPATIIFTATDGDTGSGTIAGGIITIIDDEFGFVLEKR